MFTQNNSFYTQFIIHIFKLLFDVSEPQIIAESVDKKKQWQNLKGVGKLKFKKTGRAHLVTLES